MNTNGEPGKDGQPSVETELLAEAHWRTRDDRITLSCQDSVRAHPAALRSVAHFSNGALDFVVRPQNAAPLATPRRPENGTASAEGRPGRHLVSCTEDFNHSMQGLGTGELMRVVVGTGSGGMFCGRIRAGQYLVGITLGADRLDELDTVCSDLVRCIRTDVHHLPDELLGGERGRDLPEVAESQKLHFDPGLSVGDDERLRALWHRFVTPEDLQYAAYYRDWSLVCAGDAFDDQALSPRLLGIAPRARRAMYRDLAARLRVDITRLRGALRPVTRAPIDRLVLDVQEGAVYIHWLGRGTGSFALGVTVDQYRVDDAENRLRGLLTTLPPLPPRP